MTIKSSGVTSDRRTTPPRSGTECKRAARFGGRIWEVPPCWVAERNADFSRQQRPWSEGAANLRALLGRAFLPAEVRVSHGGTCQMRRRFRCLSEFFFLCPRAFAIQIRMRWRISFWLVLSLGWLLAGPASAQPYQNYQLTDGKAFSGRTVQFTDGFVQFALEGPTATYTNIRWGRLSQASLQELAKNKFAAPHATPFIDTPPTARPPAVAKASELTLKPVPRLDRPSGGGLSASPVMLLLFFMIYLGNIYAAYEISIFRQQNTPMVCGLAAILPVLGPIIFLAIPTRPAVVEEEAPPEAPPAPAEEYVPPPVEEYAPPPPPEQTGPVIPDPVIFQRGTSTFNRRFFETKMASFLRVVPAESDKDMVVFVKSSRGEHAGRRISKIGPADLSLLVQKGNASEEIMIPFVEITEVHIKHKDS